MQANAALAAIEKSPTPNIVGESQLSMRRAYAIAGPYMVGTTTLVLSVLIARASDQSLETFLRERLFEPRGIKDTGFSVPETSLDWLAVS